MTEEIIKDSTDILSRAGILCWHEFDSKRMVIVINIEDSVYWLKKTERIITFTLEKFRPAGIPIEIKDNRGYVKIFGKLYRRIN